MNNKGFTISTLIYGILIIFLLLVFSTLSVLVTRGSTLSKIKKSALNNVKNVDETIVGSDIVADWNTFNINSEASNIITLDYNLNVYSTYDITNSISGNQITYSVTDKAGTVKTITKNINTNADVVVNNYDTIGEEEEVILLPGLYKLESWGKKSGNYDGIYSVGYLYTKDYIKVYITPAGNKETYSLIALTPGDYYSLDENDILMASGYDWPGFGTKSIRSDKLINSSSYVDSCTNESPTPDCKNQGNGYIRITSLVYFTK